MAGSTRDDARDEAILGINQLITRHQHLMCGRQGPIHVHPVKNPNTGLAEGIGVMTDATHPVEGYVRPPGGGLQAVLYWPFSPPDTELPGVGLEVVPCLDRGPGGCMLWRAIHAHGLDLTPESIIDTPALLKYAARVFELAMQ